MKKGLLFLILLFFQIFVYAQQDAWVYLTDKQNVETSIANPIIILTQKAIDRKNNHNVTIDERDVPVNESYITQLKNAMGITVMAKSKWFNAVHVRGNKIDIDALASLGFVTSIDFADKSLNTSKKVNQKESSKFESKLIDFSYGNAFNQINMIRGDELHLLDYTGTGMTVAVLDAGFPSVNTMAAFQRLRNAGHILDVYDFVGRDHDVYTNTTSKHGTWVLSTMAGYVENQFVGTAPDAFYYLFITEDDLSENPVEESYWVEAAERADSLGVDVINTSLGYKAYDNSNYSYTNANLDGQTAFITKGANIAFEKGLLLINSAGNEGNAGTNAPADSPNVLSVGAVNPMGTYASFSSVGSAFQPTQKPDVVAQGLASYVVDTNDVIGTLNGTSFSSPILAGGIVCLWQALPNKTNAEIMQLVRESASQYNSPDYYLGYGIPNLLAALNTGLSLDDNNEENLEEILLFPNPTSGDIYLKLPSQENAWALSFYDMLGRQVNKFLILDNTNPIDVSALVKGVYILKIESRKTSKNFKFIKK
ncbi:S8 family serine peptidase [Confluentibacter sediminis]|uniref:S8 family serine peptidase n=1 Tax=Confluentibacter sediminis TaxID=2219045 RepID=UPI000DADB480|nr:S8 family serine peptidase [Confluentibacter sediminis]